MKNGMKEVYVIQYLGFDGLAIFHAGGYEEGLAIITKARLYDSLTGAKNTVVALKKKYPFYRFKINKAVLGWDLAKDYSTKRAA